MFVSKYVTRYEIEDYIVYYHSLRMKPVFLTKEEDHEMTIALLENRTPSLDTETLSSLEQYLILVDSDEGVLKRVKKYAPTPYISLSYFVLTEQCNLSCSYCFLGNGKEEQRNITNYPMSKDTADRALKFFCRQTQQDPKQFEDEKEIIFYGGEPLINFEVLKYVVERSKWYQRKGQLSQKLKFSIVTNGLLLDNENIHFFKNNNIDVSISIDGANRVSNQYRKDKSGKEIFFKLQKKLYLARDLGLKFGLSITITKETMQDIDGLIAFLKKLEIDSICFNILLQIENGKFDQEYYKSATKFLLDFYKKTKKESIYEERITRKIKSFIESKIYFSDCAATSGSQIVITPDGAVGLCHGCIENRDYFIGSISDEKLIVENHHAIQSWCKLIPIYKEQCELCPALGICGGGCPIQAQRISPFGDIRDRDRAFCIHARGVLEFLLAELLKLILRSKL